MKHSHGHSAFGASQLAKRGKKAGWVGIAQLCRDIDAGYRRFWRKRHMAPPAVLTRWVMP